jgi:hypothetical protein
MANLIDKYLANGLRDFAGLEVRGSVPVKQEVLNELLADLLQQGQAGGEEAPATPEPPAAPGAGHAPALNPRDLLRHVKGAQVRAEDGRLVLDFEVRIEP